MKELWFCETCGEGFGDTWAAIEHCAANREASIWPSY